MERVGKEVKQGFVCIDGKLVEVSKMRPIIFESLGNISEISSRRRCIRNDQVSRAEISGSPGASSKFEAIKYQS